MGIFTKKPKVAFAPDELPMGNASSASASASGRRNSLFPNLLGFSEGFGGGAQGAVPGQSQTTFLGRKMSTAIVPAFARKASLAVAERDRNPRHLRMGETDPSHHGYGTDMERAFFDAKLELDAPSIEEDMASIDEKSWTKSKLDKGKQKAPQWNAKLGWEPAPPKGSARSEKIKDKSVKKSRSLKHRTKRAQRNLDDNLDAFNSFAQNGQLSLTRSKLYEPSLRSHPGTDPGASVTSFQSYDKPTSNAPSTYDTASYLSSDRPKAVPVGDGFDALDVMADHIFRIGVQKKKWFKPPKMGVAGEGVATGLTIRAKTGLYRTFPVNYEALEPFEVAVTRLNPEVAIKIDSQIVRNIVRSYIDPSPSMTELVIDENTRIQILDSMPSLGRARKHQYAAFIRDEGVMIVWADDVDAIIPAAEILEGALIHFIWRGEEENAKYNQALVVDAAISAEEKEGADIKEEDLDPEDIETRKVKKRWKERPVVLYAPLFDAMSIMLCMCLIALGLRTLIKEYALDGGVARFALFIFAPALFCIASFACMCLITSIWQTFGPVRQVTQKSLYFSGVAPKRTMGELPHVTVQLPVYKESLDEVIRPTVESLKKAITTYERQGGSVGIIVCDDGLQLLSKEDADERRRFYFDNNIAYVARPGHNVDGFVRKGRFKKAGNMNFTNALSLRVEEVMDELRPLGQANRPADHFWSENDENAVYDKALEQVLQERQGKAWAAGNIRIGPYILLIDSDTRVPEDCFADAVSEMAESPEVAIIQHMSGVMQVAHHFFENGVAHFTWSIQHAISYCCASGEVAPFVGHNAFLRWAALQECMFIDPDDGVNKIWSEDHVSEDFAIAVTLQIKGYVVRWATYSNGDFQEGVSLTCDDELNRWQKYAFGCSELLFHPIKQWFTKGPITPLFHRFMWSNIPLHSKFTICGYVFSYYAISAAWPLTVLNYFVEGWNIPVDGYYLPSWHVTMVCLILFVGISNVAYIVLRYRLKLPGASQMAFDQIKWIPFFSIFFIGMSMPMSAALVSHLVGYNMTWSTTVKTVQKSNFFLQIPIIWRRFWPQLVFFGLCVPMMIITSSNLMPSGYRVNNVEVFVPMGILTGSHLLYPFALNPWFLSFSF